MRARNGASIRTHETRSHSGAVHERVDQMRKFAAAGDPELQSKIRADRRAGRRELRYGRASRSRGTQALFIQACNAARPGSAQDDGL